MTAILLKDNSDLSDMYSCLTSLNDGYLFITAEIEPLSLQELCRSKVRQLLRENVWVEHPELEKRNLSLPDRQPRTDPFFDESDVGVSDDDEEEEEEDDDDEDDDNDDELADGHIIRRFLFNMEVDSNETTSHPVQLRRVAMLVQQRIDAEQPRAEALLDRIPEESRNDDLPITAASPNSPEQDGSSGTTASQNMDASPSLALDLSHNETQELQELQEPQEPQVSQHWSGGRLVCNRGRSTNERITLDTDSDRDSDCDSADEFLTQWRKIAKRENTDSGIVDDVNIPYDDTSSSLNVDHSDSDAEDDMDVDLSSVALRETFRRVCESRSKDLSPSQPVSEDAPVPDYVESRLFVAYMKEKIQLLPLPTKLKLYMNHNRNL